MSKNLNTHQIKSLGALEFSDEGILFVGDNIAGAIIAFDFSSESKTTEPALTGDLHAQHHLNW